MAGRKRRPAGGRAKEASGRDNSRLWKLEDAKARFSEVVRRAKQRGPQRVTVHGKDAVVIVAAEEFDRLKAIGAAPTLRALFANSPLKDIEFGEEPAAMPVREVEL